jgi:hypothetical protein
MPFRIGAIYYIVIAYDGSIAGVGRIVADSTWHHHMNVNLKGFPPGDSMIAQFARFYVNLAVWLSPPATAVILRAAHGVELIARWAKNC